MKTKSPRPNRREKKTAVQPKAPLTPFDKETLRRRREMLRVLGERTAPVQNKALKGALWKGVSRDVHNVMRAKPVRRAPRGS